MANKIYHSQYTVAQIEDAISNCVPMLMNGTWWRWDIHNMTYVDTGVLAESADYAKAAGESADAAEKSADAAKTWASTPPYIGPDYYWYVYDAEAMAYKNSNVKSVGPQGPRGKQGIPGTAAEKGATFTPSVTEAGMLSWSNDGGLENPENVDLVAAVLAAMPDADGGSY